ncbi:phytoene desaturase family protein [Aquisphaera insulae]|uniref:phytoene desaturase family protein n=1 Tax=Aquisphaera insulae TaxID=2712864 RepID=UPI00196A572D|nr:phytoene desaturase family protein [Aquisphaera insulae]
MRASMARRVGVIGGGLGGLASACTLAARGYDVVLFEKNPWLGGKAAELSEAGYRFDMGPTILLMPSVLRRIFAEAGRDLADEIELIPLDPQWRSFFADGSVLDLHADVERMVRTLDGFAAGGAARGYRAFHGLSRRLESISHRYFFWRSIGSLRDMFDAAKALRISTLSDVLSMRPWSTVSGLIRAKIDDPRVAQMLDHFTQYVGSSPDLSPAVLCGIAHIQTGEGVWYPRGGTRAVASTLARLAADLGVEFQIGRGVRSIATDPDGAVSGVELEDGHVERLGAVISNCDAVRTHRELLAGRPAARRFEKRRGYEAACSGVVLYLGLDRRYDQLLHHNFVFSRDPHEEFASIYGRGEPAGDPTCYVCAPARTDPTVAPPGGEALYVLVHTPYLRLGQDWSEIFPAYRRTIIEKLRTTAGLDDLESRIRLERWLTPQDIHDRYRVLNGAIYGLSSHGRLTGAFKPANRSPDVRGLYLAGGAAHPGPGMPMVMMSGWIAADALDQDRLAGNLGWKDGNLAADKL